MPEYHGDVMYRTGRIYESRDDANYFIAILFLLFFGCLGAHRFYLNDLKIGWIYFTAFAVSALIGVAMLDFTLLLWVMGISFIFLAGELFYFIWKLVSR
jgi:hypothetical protein